MKHLFRHISKCALFLLLPALLNADSCCNTSCNTSDCSSSCNSCCDTSCGTSCDTSCGTCSSSSNCCCSSSCDNNCCSSCCDSDYVNCKSHFTPRSQSFDGARLLAGARHEKTHLYDKDEIYGSFDVALAYQRSFKGEKLGKFISPTCSNSFSVGADNKPTTNVRADDFGLDCTGCVTLCPRIESFIADLDFWVGLNGWAEGLWFDVQLPIVHTWWKPNCSTSGCSSSCNTSCCNTNSSSCDDEFPESYMSTDADKTAVGFTNIQDAMNGQNTWGDVLNNLNCAKLCCCKDSTTQLADLRMRIGYDFLLKENYYMGLKIVGTAPTGNTADACVVWEAIAGNGGHWELGGGLTAKAVLWDKDEDTSLSWFLDAEVSHMFKSRSQKRTFDLCENGCWSRYLLLKKFSVSGDDVTLAGLERGPNVFTQCVKTSFNVVANITSFFNFKWNNWLFDLGYDGWFRSNEKLCCISSCIPENTFGIKGIQNMSDDDDEDDISTASTSTIAIAGDPDDVTTYIANSSNVFNHCSGLHPSANSQGVFGHIGYMWADSDWTPNLGLGGKVEFSGRGNRAASQWEIWLKGGVSF